MENSIYKDEELKDLLKKERRISWNLYKIGQLLCSNLNIKEVFSKQGFDKIAVYGYGKVGQLFMNLMSKNNVEIGYCIDKKANIYGTEIEIRHNIEDIDNSVDVIIVTADYYFDEIKSEINNYLDIKILSVTKILEELMLCGNEIL